MPIEHSTFKMIPYPTTQHLYYQPEFDVIGVLEVITDTYKVMRVGFGAMTYSFTFPAEHGWVYIGEF